MKNAGKDYLDERQVAALLGISLSSLQQWRHRRQGPEFMRVGRLVRYRRSAIEQWLDSRTVRPTTQVV
ncbi:MAG TPA: helix-turn-helix domain-containing protein [Candidatus Binataceae bacterium]|nr:helix-turn-helix domain-containing protein [Candidatus Binataceae bacterium]HVA80276.1 helix-turn-helix domain-containing protein [Candidatus Binataceae bacterium]